MLKRTINDIEVQTKVIYKELVNFKEKIPPSHVKTLKTIKVFEDELEYLISQMKKINTELIPDLQGLLKLKFQTPKLLMFALSRPSIRNTYEQLKTFFEKESSYPIHPDSFDELASLGEFGNVLALIGDAALDLAIIKFLWESSDAFSVTVGEITETRKDYVSNENLAKVCDHMNLYKYKLDRLNIPIAAPKKETINHEKATLTEAIFGVIYLEYGIEGISKRIPIITNKL